MGAIKAETLCYFRFVDDVFAITLNIEGLVSALASWRPSIIWEISGQGFALPYLDLEIHLTNGKLWHTLFRKPLNAYLYLPGASCHPATCKEGIVRGEVLRTLSACSHTADAKVHVQFFINKFSRRGYPKALVERLAFQTLCRSNRVTRLSARQASAPQRTINKARRIPFIIQYSSSVNAGRLRRALTRHAHLLQRSCGGFPGLVWTVQPNRFMRMYSSNWQR